jgi:hypothetical protein
MRVITILAGLASAFVASASPHPQHTGENLNATMPIHHQQGTGRERCLIDLKGVPMPKEDLAHLIADTPSDPITVDLYFHVIYTDKTVQGGWIEVGTAKILIWKRLL